LTDEDKVLHYSRQNLSAEQKVQARANIGASFMVATDEIYFNITEDGVISLKPEYRGAVPSSSDAAKPYWSNNGAKIAGTQSKELPEEIVIPETVSGITVTALSNFMFSGIKNVKRIVLPICIEVIPEALCYNTWNLQEIINTENVKSMGSHAFANTSIRKAYFPSLTEFSLRSNGSPSTSHFSGCACLVTADLGQVFMQPRATVPKMCFNGCERLVCLHNADGITSIGQYGFFGTRRIKNLSFLPNLTNIGDYGFLISGVNYDWNNLTGCTFGVKSTSKDINTTNYSDCTFTVCNTPMRSTFDQRNPLWANKNIGNCPNTYSTGCATVSAAMIYSALIGVDMESPEEFVSAVGAVNNSLLDLDIADGVNNTTGEGDFWTELVRWFDAVGLRAVVYNSVSATNIQVMYDALASGALVWGRILADHTDGNHCVVFHGVNSDGELLVTDPSSYGSVSGHYEAATYAMPIQNFMRDHGDVDHFIVVTKK
jgi:hypothetical protein